MKSLLLLILSTFTTFAEVALKFDEQGEFIPPDVILQARGLNSYADGYEVSAMRNFKESAQFGNERSKYLIALLNFQNQDWASGYAWLNLIEASVEKRDDLLKKIKPMLTDIELSHSNKVLDSLKKEYNEMTSFQRRNKWDRSFQGTGTHIRGIRAATLRNTNYNFGDYNITPQMIRKQVYENYILEYEPRGQVILGVIETIEKNN